MALNPFVFLALQLLIQVTADLTIFPNNFHSNLSTKLNARERESVNATKASNKPNIRIPYIPGNLGPKSGGAALRCGVVVKVPGIVVPDGTLGPGAQRGNHNKQVADLALKPYYDAGAS